MAKLIGQNTTLAVDKTGSGTYTVIAQVLTLDGPSTSVGEIETTNLSSTRKEYRPGIPDSGSLTASIQFDAADTTHTYLASLAATPEILSWQVSFPTTPATLFTTDGFLTEFSPSVGGVESVIEASITVKLTDALVISTAGGGV